jgi:hypothetical protein
MKTIYQYGLEGNFMRSFKDDREASKVLGMRPYFINQIIFRKSIHNRQYYLSHDPIFVFPKHKSNHNPLKRAGTYLNIDKDIEALDRDIRSGEFNYNDLLCNLIRV